MTYWALNAAFLLPAGALALAIGLRMRNQRRRNGVRHDGLRGRTALAAAAATAVVLLALTAVFDNVMIAAGLFDYSAEKISGAMIGRMPLEDFAYPLGAVLLLPALWLVLDRRGSTVADGEETHD